MQADDLNLLAYLLLLCAGVMLEGPVSWAMLGVGLSGLLVVR